MVYGISRTRRSEHQIRDGRVGCTASRRESSIQGDRLDSLRYFGSKINLRRLLDCIKCLKQGLNLSVVLYGEAITLTLDSQLL